MPTAIPAHCARKHKRHRAEKQPFKIDCAPFTPVISRGENNAYYHKPYARKLRNGNLFSEKHGSAHTGYYCRKRHYNGRVGKRAARLSLQQPLKAQNIGDGKRRAEQHGKHAETELCSRKKIYQQYR